MQLKIQVQVQVGMSNLQVNRLNLKPVPQSYYTK
jgi:hypothetical protein